MAGKAAQGKQAEIRQHYKWVLRAEAVVALEDQGRQPKMTVLMMVLTAARAFSQPYLVPPIIMAEAVVKAVV